MLQRICLWLLLVGTSVVQAHAFETLARSAWVYDVATQTVLMAKNAQTPYPPASMSKLMTINMAFEAMADGRITPETQMTVSTKAREMGGSTSSCPRPRTCRRGSRYAPHTRVVPGVP